MVLMSLPQANFNGWIKASAIANFLMILGMCIPVCYQTYLAIAFNRRSEIKSSVFAINASIPAIFFLLYLSRVAYSFCINLPVYHDSRFNGPVRVTHFNNFAWVVVFLMIHAAVTFLFVNHRYVTSTIKKIADPEEQMLLKANYLVPMQILVRTVLIVYATSIVVMFILDIVGAIVKT